MDWRFDKWLYDEMVKRGWDIQTMAEKTGLTRVAIAYYIGGARLPHLTSLLLILDALGMHLEIKEN